MKSFVLSFLALASLATFPAAAQTSDIPKSLSAYTSCHFPDDLLISNIDPLAPGVTARWVDTSNGSKRIDMAAGIRVMFRYPLTDFYANVKVELLPAAEYPNLKKDLLANFEYLAQSSGNVRNTTLPSQIHGFETYGEDRDQLKGGVLGFYLLFDDKTQAATTIYFLNQDEWQRKFQTVEEYRRLRDQFLQAYTGCIRENQALTAEDAQRSTH